MMISHRGLKSEYYCPCKHTDCLSSGGCYVSPPQGEKYDLNNYRGITVSSNLGKLFCSIINDRLVQSIQEHKILNNCQIGFRPKHRTPNQHVILQVT